MRKLIFIGLLLCITACAAPKTLYPDIDRVALQNERRKQEEMFALEKIRKKNNKAHNKLEQQQRLDRVSSQILEAGVQVCANMYDSIKNCFFDFELSDSKDVNAYADGKKIVVTTAMMSFADTDEDLALVLGHEYAHNIMGHVRSTQTNMLIGQILGSLVDQMAASQGVGTGSAFGKIGAQAGQLGYSQSFEKEADYIGLYITSLSGFYIDTAPEFWRKMSMRNEKAIYLASTHPTNPERTLGLQQTVKEIKKKRKEGLNLIPNIKTK